MKQLINAGFAGALVLAVTFPAGAQTNGCEELSGQARIACEAANAAVDKEKNPKAWLYALGGFTVLGLVFLSGDDDDDAAGFMPVPMSSNPDMLGFGYNFAIPGTEHSLSMSYEGPVHFYGRPEGWKYRIGLSVRY